MFHVFFVSRGYMLVLDPPVGVDLAMGSIYELQRCIQDATGVDVQEQVLFLSGGESIAHNEMLCTYAGAGTDTNPVYLVRKVPGPERDSQISTPERDGINNLYQNWRSSVEKAEKMAPTTAEYVKLGKLGVQCSETMFKFCAKVVSEHQHLNQGWMAVISNLDENVNRMQKGLDRMLAQCSRLTAIKERGEEMMVGFSAVLQTLSKIVVPANLLAVLPQNPQTGSDRQLSDSFQTSSSVDTTLYDYISSKDPAYSLNLLAEHVVDHLQKTDDSELREAEATFRGVCELARKPDYRDIRGIDRRLAMLDSRLRSLEEMHLAVKELANRIVQPVQAQDSSPSSVMAYQRARVEELSKALTDFHNCGVCFIDSKLELLRNICQRLSGWVRQSYERLQQVNKRMILFEEKYGGLKQRLDLIRQIKEAPDIYMISVAEVVRREALHREFGAWMKSRVEKCTKFINEENRRRSDYYSRLEKHFLRQLFTGMSDEVPNFAPTPPDIDLRLPRVDDKHLVELRKMFPDKESQLSCPPPRVFARLAASDPNISMVSLNNASVGSMPRADGSIFSGSSPYMHGQHEMANSPPMGWLSDSELSEENVNVSPVTTTASNFLMARRHDYSSNTSLSLESHAPTPPSLDTVSVVGRSFQATALVGDQQASRQRSTMSPLKSSEPIAIPQSAHQSHRCDAETRGVSNSERSSNFSTPDDNFGSLGKYVKTSFPSLEPLAQSVSLVDFGEKLPPIRAALLALAQFAFSLKLEVEESRGLAARSIEQGRVAIREAFDTNGLRSSQKVASAVADLKGEHERAMKQQCDELEAKFAHEREELSKIVEHERYLRREKESELGEQTSLAKHLNEQIVSLMKAKDDLHAECMRMEQERKQLHDQLEIESSVDYLSIELKAMEQLLKRSLTDNEIREIKAEIDKRKTVKATAEQASSTGVGPAIAPSVEHTGAEESHIRRGEYEKAYKVEWSSKDASNERDETQRAVGIQKKMELIVKGVEEKKNKEMAHMRDELEAEIRGEWESYVGKMKSKIADLEQRVQLYESSTRKDDERMETSQIVRVSSAAVAEQADTAHNEGDTSPVSGDMTQSSRYTSSSLNPLQESCMELADVGASAGPSKLEAFSSVEEDHLASVGRVIENVGCESATIAQGSRPESVEVPPDEPRASGCAYASKTSTPSPTSAFSAHSRAVQTHIQLRDMRSMFSLVNIHIGCSVIIHWRNDFKTYVVQCNSPTLHFVKSACLAKFGLDLKSATPPSTLIGVVTTVDTCKIVKEKNRFNLPVDTKIAQVSVEPLS